jgi:hypothetical protein
MTLGGLAGNFAMGILSAVTGKDYAFALNSMVNETPAWFTFVCVCICAPLGEELLFRKLLIDRTRGHGDTIAILLSGLLFGLFHGNLFQFFYAFLVGMVLAYVYTRTGRYLPCVAMHAAINFMGSVVTPLLSRRLIPYLEDPEAILNLFSDPPALLCYAALMLWQYGMLVAGLALLATRYRRRALSRGSCPLDGGRTNALCNPGLAACAAVMAAIMVVNLLWRYKIRRYEIQDRRVFGVAVKRNAIRVEASLRLPLSPSLLQRNRGTIRRMVDEETP